MTGVRECLGVLPPRLLQDHSPSGEPSCTALVHDLKISGEGLVKPRHQVSQRVFGRPA
ncbi:hypothetical protein SynBIOSE41_04346 [Synechococcus sp. BIOS-E4-1]|nr:hypothetical protein SynBIOSE41_04346 [Synechococcus sp. BIOS-E4-1]